MRRKIRVMIVDDHDIARKGVREMLNEYKGAEEITVVAEVDSGEEAVKRVRQINDDTDPKGAIDVVLMDIKMPGMGGVEATRLIGLRNKMFSDHYDTVKVIALTAGDSDDHLIPSQLLQYGASGYLTKDCGVVELARVIEKCHRGGRYLSPQIAQRLAFNDADAFERRYSPKDLLSGQETKIMMLIADGMMTETICKILNINRKTVSTYRRRIFEKLGVHNDVQLTKLAIMHNMLEDYSYSKKN